jgi:phosphoribosylglycinamide formyltransferase-1
VSGKPDRLAVLVSGRGSNLQALLDAIAGQRLDAGIVGVFSNQPAADALERVAPPLRWSLDAKQCSGRAEFDQRMADAIAERRPDWIVCAGYMRILGDDFVRRFAGRMLNIHPSLLPKYPGLHTHVHAIEAGDTEHGASVHFVNEHLDAGALIAQAVIPIIPGDTPDALAARLLPREHRLLTAVMRLAVAGRLAERNGKAEIDGHCLLQPLRLDCDGSLMP